MPGILMRSDRRILIVTRNMPPLVGGMERLIYNAYRELKREYQVHVVGPSGCEHYLDDGDCSDTIPVSPPMRFLTLCQWRSLQAARTFRPDLVLAGSGVTVPAAWLAARLTGGHLMCMLHGLDISNRSAIYGAAFIPAIRRCDTVIANSRFTAELAAQRGVARDHIHVIHPGVDEPKHVAAEEIQAFRNRLGAEHRPILLSVGRLTERKGLVEFVANCLPEIVAQMPDVLLVIIGGDAKDALISLQPISATLKRIVSDLSLENHVVVLGQLEMTDPMLRAAYAASDLHVFPVLNRPTDIEGFGMVSVEAASYGLPTVAFAVGGVTDAIKQQVSGYLVPAGDYVSFRNTVIEHLRSARSDSAWKESCAGFAREFYWPCYGEALRSLVRASFV